MNCPELYKHANSLQRRDASEMLSKYLHLVQWTGADDEAVLDIGCGSGDVTFDLVWPRIPRSARLVGADVSSEMVSYAERKFPELEFRVLDVAGKVPEDFKEEFDHVVSVYCLHWVKNQRQAMQNLHKILKPGGDILMCYLASNPIYDVYLNMAKTPKWKTYMKDLHKYISPFHFIKDVEGSLRKILTETGFEIVLCECNKKMFEYENISLVKKAVIAVNPFYSKLPDNLKDQFINDYVKELNRHTLIEENNNNYSKSEVISFSYRLITVCVKKPFK